MVNPISPKVTHSAIVGLGITILLAVLAAVAGSITPEALTPVVGAVWAAPLATLVTTALTALAGYLKKDPLRVDAVAVEPAPPVTATPPEAPIGKHAVGATTIPTANSGTLTTDSSMGGLEYRGDPITLNARDTDLASDPRPQA